MKRIVAHLDASGISKDLFVQFVGDGDDCLIKQEISLTWSSQLYIIE